MGLSEYNDWKLNYSTPDKGTSKDGSTRDAGETNSIYAVSYTHLNWFKKLQSIYGWNRTFHSKNSMFMIY